MEFLKGDCVRITSTKKKCDWCKEHDWTSIKPSKRTPRPNPETTKLANHHYLPIANTPIHNDEGRIREYDDYQPRAQLMKFYAEGNVSSNGNTKIEEFSKKWIVSESLIIDLPLLLSKSTIPIAYSPYPTRRLDFRVAFLKLIRMDVATGSNWNRPEQIDIAVIKLKLPWSIWYCRER